MEIEKMQSYYCAIEATMAIIGALSQWGKDYYHGRGLLYPGEVSET